MQARTPPAPAMKRTLPATNKEHALRTCDPRSGGVYVVYGWDNAWRSKAPGPHTHGNIARQVVDGLRTEVWGQQREPIRQLLGDANVQTAHPATSSTAPAHQPLGSANAETTPAGAPAAAADRKQRPNTTCEGMLFLSVSQHLTFTVLDRWALRSRGRSNLCITCTVARSCSPDGVPTQGHASHA